MSHKAEDIKEIKASVLKVAQEKKRGRNQSKILLDDIDPKMLQLMEILDENQEGFHRKATMLV